MLESTLVGIVAALSTLGFSYWVSYKFFSSKHAVINKGSEFDDPGGVISSLITGLFAGVCLFSGLYASIFFFWIFGDFLGPAVANLALLSSTSGGLVGGIAGMSQALSQCRNSQDSLPTTE